MAALTGQELVSSIAQQLRSRFSKKEFEEIYKDKVVQSLKTPCIFIHSIETVHTPDMREYAWWDHIIDIRCHPGRMQTNIHTWARTLGPMVMHCVQYVTVCDQTVKAKNMTCRVEDDVLHVTATYSYRVMRQLDEVPDMETLVYGQRVKQ